MSNAIAGTLSIMVNGQAYAIAGAGTYLVSSTSRETLKGQDGVHGFKEMPDVGFISWQGRDSGALSMTTLNSLDGVTVIADLKNGKTIIATNAWRDGEPAEVNTEDATFTVKFASASVTEN